MADNHTTHKSGRYRIPAESIEAARDLGARLRSVMLNDISGIAAAAVKIDGVMHEYQAVPGVREDALQLIMNLKRLRVSHSRDRFTAKLDSSDPIVKAGDLDLAGGRPADPDHVLAHVAEGGRLTMQILFERGVGHRAAGEAPEGFIPIESDFSPIRKVAIDPGADALEISVETDGAVSPDSVLREAFLKLSESRDYEKLEFPQAPPRPVVEFGPEFDRNPFQGLDPEPLSKIAVDSYRKFLTQGLPELLSTLFPLRSRPVDEELESEAPGRTFTRDRRIDLISHRLEMPRQTPDQCLRECESFEARLYLRTRMRSGSEEQPPARIIEEEVDMGPIPMMAEDASLIIHGHRRAVVMFIDDSLRIERVGDILMKEVGGLINRMKPVLEDRLNVSEWPPTEILKLLPLSQTLYQDLVTSLISCQYMDETNPLASQTHTARVMSKVFAGGDLSKGSRSLSNSHFGRLGYLETPEGPNIGLIHSLCPFVKIDEDGTILTPYRKVEKGKAGKEIVYLSAGEEASCRIADASAVGPDGRLKDELVLVREGDDIKRIPRDEVNFAAISPLQSLSMSSALIPFLGHDDPNRALMASNMQRQAVPLIESEPPMVKSGAERKAAVDSGQLITAERAGTVVESTGERIVVAVKGERDVYELSKFRRTNQATCMNQTPLVNAGDKVSAGDVLADVSGISGGELALGRNVLVAVMPFEGWNYEDALCVSDELVSQDIFTSVHLTELYAEVGDTEVWTAPLGARVNPGDVLVQDTSGRKRSILTVPQKNPLVVVESTRCGSVVRMILAERRPVRPGDKFAGRHGNKGVVAKILPRSEMPFLEDGTTIQMIINPLGIISRMNVGQILELHYGALANALGRPLVIPPFMTPPVETLKAKLREAGLSETGMTTVYDGRTGRPYLSPVTVGRLYMLKLAHMADDKMRAFSTSGSSLLTQQPAGLGRQRLGSLEMWALNAYGADCTLQESLTIKSDDAEGRERAALAILSGSDVEPAGEGRSLELLENVLTGLGVRVKEER